MSIMFRFACTLACGLGAISAFAEEPTKLPVRAVTIFKDGYSFVNREGSLPVGDSGTAVLNDLPLPVLGTFWSYADQSGVSVRAVTASRIEGETARDAASILELLGANIGKRVTVRGLAQNSERYTATIRAVRGDNLVLLETEEGMRLVPINMLGEVTLLDKSPKLTVAVPTARPQLTFSLAGVSKGSNANLGVIYLQRGLGWIPSYKVVIDPATNKAKVSLQGTLVNDLIDLDNVTANLVIGMPTWDYKTTTDPLIVQDTLVEVARGRQDGAGFYNATQSQVGGLLPEGVDRIVAYDANNSLLVRGEPSPVTPEAPTITGNATREDLFVFTVKNIRLKRGERMVIPVAEFTLPYTDVYKLELLPTPPRDWQQAYASGNASQLPPELASLLAAPKVKHYLRLKNTSTFPLTTAPALILAGDQPLAQGTMTYTSPSGEMDLPVTGSPSITSTRTDKETGRVPEFKKWNGYSYEQVSLAGNICLTNYGAKPAALEVTRYVLGSISTASDMATVDTLDMFTGADVIPSWWSRYNLPYDLGRTNGLGRAVWKFTLAPKATKELTYSWQYLWRQ